VKTWIEPVVTEVSPALRAAVGGHPLVAEMLARRGLADPPRALAFLEPARYVSASPFELPDMAQAVSRLVQAIASDEQICIWGDFDVDGQTATALLLTTLEDLGANAGFYVPVRESEGHGVNLPGLARVIDGGARLLLTCDTGIAAHEAVEFARQRGVDVVITDHHELPERLPDAVAAVNPRRLPEDHPLRHLPGVGVAYKLAEALYAQSGRGGDAERLLDLVALGIVADVATQVGDTRYLLQRGLAALRRTERLGLRTLMETARLEPEGLSEEHIGYILAPRLNAVGRLADARAGVELLTASDLTQARILANHLETLNAKRQLQTEQVYRAAASQIEREPMLLENAALVLAHPTWPAGIIGIVASRLAEEYSRPVVLLATPPDAIARGSARSVDGCNITAAIATQAELLEGFGGHPMAAGLAITPDNIPAFRRGLSHAVTEMIGAGPHATSLPIAAYVTLDQVTIELAEELGRLAPFGAGNPPVVLAARGVTIAGGRIVGRDGEHRLVEVTDAAGASLRMIWWNGAGEELPTGAFDGAFTLRASSYLGQPQIEAVWAGYRQGEAVAEVTIPSHYEVVDYRTNPNRERLLRELAAAGTAAIWREPQAAASSPGADRGRLDPADALCIWTTPPGPAELRAALERVQPERVYLFAVDPEASGPEAFVGRLAGLVKHVLGHRQGRAEAGELAVAMASTETAVRLGLAWLEARGDLRVGEEEPGVFTLQAGRAGPTAEVQRAWERLSAALAEIAAYRGHFRRAPAERVLPARDSAPNGPAALARRQS
jgi:single-stranded-DNA-specific exonuclease